FGEYGRQHIDDAADLVDADFPAGDSQCRREEIRIAQNRVVFGQVPASQDRYGSDIPKFGGEGCRGSIGDAGQNEDTPLSPAEPDASSAAFRSLAIWSAPALFAISSPTSGSSLA